MLEAGALGSFAFAMSAATYAVSVVWGPPVWRLGRGRLMLGG